MTSDTNFSNITTWSKQKQDVLNQMMPLSEIQTAMRKNAAASILILDTDFSNQNT